MTKLGSMRSLFVSRLLLYLLAVIAPLYHPAVRIPYDMPGILLWFVLVPTTFLAAYLRVWSRTSQYLRLTVGLGLPVFAGLFLRGFSASALTFAVTGLLAFVLSYMVFHDSARGRSVALLEPFLPALLYHRLIGFSRASEALSATGIGATRLIMVVLIAGFLAHGLILYLCFFYRDSTVFRRRVRKEVLVLLALSVVVLGTIVTAVPPDFVENPIVRNLLGGESTQDPELIDEFGNQIENGALRGIPSDRWPQPSRNGGEGAPQNQHAVMIVAAERSPSYLADRYFSVLDPHSGFSRPRDKELNELSRMRTLETWRGGQATTERARRSERVTVISTLPERYLAYRPQSFEPTTLDRRYHPFSYSYRAVSEVSRGSTALHSRVRELDDALRAELSPYLDVPLNERDRRVFAEHLEGAIAGRNSYHDRIVGILRSFETFQYHAGYSNTVSIPHMVSFLSETREGDCVEFSHSTAILARMAGIPSRVVTGYLAAAELQTPSHRRGLELLIEDLPALERFDLDSLYLVTTAHRHAWVQLYLPELGWVEFETTSYSIPPVGLGDPNQRDVVIPLLRNVERTVPGPVVQPQVVLRFLAALLAVGLVGLLAYRYLLELLLMLQARSNNDRAARALFRLVLLRYATDGYPGKARSATAQEFAQEHPELSAFAKLYTELRYRTSFGEGEQAELMSRLRVEATRSLSIARRPGLWAAVRRLLSLRGLGYIS